MITNLYLLIWPTMIYPWRKKTKGKKRKNETNKKFPKEKCMSSLSETRKNIELILGYLT